MSAAQTPEESDQPELIPSGPRAIKPLKRVSAYRTSDGAIWENRPEAELREAEIAVDELARSVAEDAEGGECSIADSFIGRAEEIHAALSTLLKAQAKARAIQPLSESGS